MAKKKTPENKTHHREERVHQIRKELQILQNRWETCQEREKERIKKLRDELREKLKSNEVQSITGKGRRNKRVKDAPKGGLRRQQ